jgi:hypothetical protein
MSSPAVKESAPDDKDKSPSSEVSTVSFSPVDSVDDGTDRCVFDDPFYGEDGLDGIYIASAPSSLPVNDGVAPKVCLCLATMV